MIHPANSSASAASIDRSSQKIERQGKRDDVRESDDSDDAPIPIRSQLHRDVKKNEKPEIDDSASAPIPLSQSIQDDVEAKQKVKEELNPDAAREVINEILTAKHKRVSASSRSPPSTNEGLDYPILEATLVDDEAVEEEKQKSIHIRIEPSGPVYDAVMLQNDQIENRTKRYHISTFGLILAVLGLGLIVTAIAIAASQRKVSCYRHTFLVEHTGTILTTYNFISRPNPVLLLQLQFKVQCGLI